MNESRIERLRRLLDPLVARHQAQRPASDPFALSRGFAHPRDRELCALLCALYDFGPEAERHDALKRLFNRLGEKPARVLSRSNRTMLAELAEGMAFGFLKAEDSALLLHALRVTLRQHESLEALYQYARGEGGKRNSLATLDRFMILIGRVLNAEERARPGLAHLLPRPAKGSPVRRLHLFLRHMVRPDDGVDTGLWSQPPASRLQLPLSSSQHRLMLALKISTRQICNRGAVSEATRNLALLDPQDPVRYHLAFEQLEADGVDEAALLTLFRRA
ncbi:MAG: DUF2400 family protein [Candidatus Delongbacteria bacterium]|nr:DUF2400 family protein [Candidatus Delongbacteria bacterium]